MIYDILVNSNNIDGLFKLAEKGRYNYKPNSKEIYEKIFDICVNTNNVDELFKLAENSNYYNSIEEIYEKIFEISANNKNINWLYKLRDIFSKKNNELETIIENLDLRRQDEAKRDSHQWHNELKQFKKMREELENSIGSSRNFNYYSYRKRKQEIEEQEHQTIIRHQKKMDEIRSNYNKECQDIFDKYKPYTGINWQLDKLNKINNEIAKLENNK